MANLPIHMVNLCQKLLFLHQLTHNMTKNCSLNTSSVNENCKLRTCCEHKLFFVLFWHSEQFMYTTCSELGIFMYWTRNSINNLLSYYGLVDARISASENDLPVSLTVHSVYTLYLQHLDDEYKQVKKAFCFKNSQSK